MKILHVITSMNPKTGGPCQGLRNSIAELEKFGISKEVVCVDSPGSSYLGKDPFSIHALGPGYTSWRYSPKLTPWLLKNLSRFDVVIVNGLWQYPGFAVRKALEVIKRTTKEGERETIPRLFVMPHGMLDPYFQRASSRRIKALRNWFYWKLIEHKLINSASGILFTCQAELELAKQTFQPYCPKREINVGYGIAAPPPFVPTMKLGFQKLCPELNNKPFLLFLSRIHEKKGVDILVAAYLKIIKEKSKAQKSDPFPVLIIAGPGLETQYGKKIREIVAKNPILEKNILFPGMLTGEAKWGAFYGCEAFILPSHQENFGIAVVEAMACSKPVLISNQVNIWTEIKQAGAGLVCDESEQGVSEILEEWLTMEEEKQIQISQNARKCYEKCFGISSAALSFLKAISSYLLLGEFPFN